MKSLYEEDFVRWTEGTARALREGRLADVDFENVADEIESWAVTLSKVYFAGGALLLGSRKG